jgi:hypothetical protein
MDRIFFLDLPYNEILKFLILSFLEHFNMRPHKIWILVLLMFFDFNVKSHELWVQVLISFTKLILKINLFSVKKVTADLA